MIPPTVRGLLPLDRERRTSLPSSPASPAVVEASWVRLLTSGEVLRDDSPARESPLVRRGRGGTHAAQLRRTGRESVLARDSEALPHGYLGRLGGHARPRARDYRNRQELRSTQCRGAACCAPTLTRTSIVDQTRIPACQRRLTRGHRPRVQVRHDEANQ